ncbi:MAG: low specificity L-threonine aldolase [Luteolibacter sp.]|uniref:threonine aldolase family protein n=1 Tax=Luteolibacter sp. TaxID=1962973 RepID=UPI0032665F68
MNFTSDNWAGVHPAITENLARHAPGLAAAYGTSELDRRIERRFCEIFEREVAVYFVGTGTAANSLALAAVNRPGGVSFCHREAHMVKDECGAPEYFTGGARLQTVEGAAGKINLSELTRELKGFRPDFIHAGQPMAVSITQATEVGTIYQLDEIAAVGAVGRERNLPLHMDGARFANALVSLGVTPAEMTWKQGVDIVSFGGTKNGCWCAEALVFFNPDDAKDLPYIRKRAAQLFSKTRFIAAQFEAYLQNDLWLKLASHANAMAASLAGAVKRSSQCRLAWDTHANEVFVIVPATLAAEWKHQGAGFHEWPVPVDLLGKISGDEVLARLVANFATTEEEVAAFASLPGLG